MLPTTGKRLRGWRLVPGHVFLAIDMYRLTSHLQRPRQLALFWGSDCKNRQFYRTQQRHSIERTLEGPYDSQRRRK